MQKKSTLVFCSSYAMQAARKRKYCETDAERISQWTARLPYVKFSAVSFRADSSIAQLKKACRDRDIDTSTMIERSEVLAALVAHQKEHEECPICLEPFTQGSIVRIMLCEHEFHHDCLESALLSDFSRTGHVPRCPCCRACMRGGRS